jgi:hypothetical protein
MMEPREFAVCPHDTARGIEKWALFHTRVNRALDLKSRFTPHISFADFGKSLRAGEFLWAYVNPADFVHLRALFGFRPLVRPASRFDLARIIGRAGGGPVPVGARVARVPGYLATVVEAQWRERGLSTEAVSAQSYAEVVKLVDRGVVDFGITYNEHFDVLPEATRERFGVIETIDLGLSHVVAAHPSLDDRRGAALTELLFDTGPVGAQVRAAIDVERFDLPEETSFRYLETLLYP